MPFSPGYLIWKSNQEMSVEIHRERLESRMQRDLLKGGLSFMNLVERTDENFCDCIWFRNHICVHTQDMYTEHLFFLSYILRLVATLVDYVRILEVNSLYLLPMVGTRGIFPISTSPQAWNVTFSLRAELRPSSFSWLSQQDSKLPPSSLRLSL